MTNIFRSCRNKKGNAPFDVATILIVIVMLGITSVVGYMVFDDTNTDFQAEASHNVSKDVAQDLFDIYPALLDNIFLFAFVLMLIFTLVSVFLLDTHPIFFIVSVILLITVFIAAILLGNVYDSLMTDATLATYANSFTYTTWLMQHIVQVFIGIGFIIMITLFVKFKM